MNFLDHPFEGKQNSADEQPLLRSRPHTHQPPDGLPTEFAMRIRVNGPRHPEPSHGIAPQKWPSTFDVATSGNKAPRRSSRKCAAWLATRPGPRLQIRLRSG